MRYRVAKASFAKTCKKCSRLEFLDSRFHFSTTNFAKKYFADTVSTSGNSEI